MLQDSHLQFLKNHQIDKLKWDECITNSANCLIYARAFYLDHMAEGWSALVGENYEWVFPITKRSKYGIPYISPPKLSQQLGVFARPNVIVPFVDILEWLNRHYLLWEINFNYLTDNALLPTPNTKSATNYILDLSRGYESIASNYQKDLVKNLRRSNRIKLRYLISDDYSKGIDLFKKYYGSRLVDMTANDYRSFGKICAFTAQKNMLVCREVVGDSNELMSMALMIKDKKRLYNLMNVTTKTGRCKQANHFLIDHVIKEYSGTNLIFDFEGSDVPGIHSFYKNFGGENQPFYQVKYNNLPWPLRALKG